MNTKLNWLEEDLGRPSQGYVGLLKEQVAYQKTVFCVTVIVCRHIYAELLIIYFIISNNFDRCLQNGWGFVWTEKECAQIDRLQCVGY